MKSEIKALAFLALLSAVSVLVSCRGETSEKNPIWIKHGMEYQPKWLPYGKNTFTSDERNMQHPPAGTVADGLLKADLNYYQGGDSGKYLSPNPLKVTAQLMERGHERFNIYCTPCHGQTGLGNGIVVQRGFLQPPSFHDERILNLADGEMFHIISYGIRNMPSYGKQIPEEDRWAIVAYIRALQRSQHATISDVPESERANLK